MVGRGLSLDDSGGWLSFHLGGGKRHGSPSAVPGENLNEKGPSPSS